MGVDAPALEDPAVLGKGSMWRPLALAAALIACGEPPKETKTPPPEVTLYGVTMSTYRGSKLAAHGEASQLVYERSSGDAQSTATRLHVPSRPGAEPQTVVAPRVSGNLLAKQAIGEGGVELLGQNGLVGRTERAHFDGVHLIADGQDPIRVDGPGYRMTAGGFSFALETEEFSFEGPVAAAFGGER
jgi:hypothetical protein